MTLTQAIAYGIVQGLTEFLPISSSAHLVLLPWFLKWKDPGLAFDVALHWGTLFGVVVYFWRDLMGLVVGGVRSLSGGRDHEHLLLWKIGVGTVPAAVAGFLLDDLAETVFRSPWVIAGTLFSVAILLHLADRPKEKRNPLDTITWRQAVLIGVAQAFAIVPGVSRSGITMTAALFLSLNRSAAVRFSFLLSIPIILGAGVLKISYLLENLGNPIFWTGILAAAIAGFSAIHFLMTHVRTRSFTPFVLYRIALAFLIVFWLLK